MLTKYEIMQRNAKHFDDIYVVPKNRIINCDSNRLITDYLILKANQTKCAFVVIVHNNDWKNQLVIDELCDRTSKIPLIYSKFDAKTLLTQSLVFTNGSYIRVLPYSSAAIDIRGYASDIIYIHNEVALTLMAVDTMNSLAASLKSGGRLIYGYDHDT